MKDSGWAVEARYICTVSKKDGNKTKRGCDVIQDNLASKASREKMKD